MLVDFDFLIDLAPFLVILLFFIFGFLFLKISDFRDRIFIQSYLRRKEGQEDDSQQIFLVTLVEEIFNMSLRAKLLVIAGSIMGTLGCALWLGITFGFIVQPVTIKIFLFQIPLHFVILVFSVLIVLFGIASDEMGR